MAYMSFHSTTGWTLLAGLLILYAPQSAIFHEVNTRSIGERSDSIHYSDRAHVTAEGPQSTIVRRRRYTNSSSSSGDEGTSNAMGRSRYQSRPATSDRHGAGPSSRPDHSVCHTVPLRWRIPPPNQHGTTDQTLRLFLRPSNWTYQERERFRTLIIRKVPDIEKGQFDAICESFRQGSLPPWSREQREYFVRGFLREPPIGWNQTTCEEYLRVYFQTESPGWSAEQKQYVIEHIFYYPPRGFNAEDRNFYLDGFLLEHPWCWQSGLREVFTELFNRNIPRGKEQTYRPLLECFLQAPPECWTDEQRKEVVYGFLQGPPRGWSPEQRLQFMHRFADVPFENRCLFFGGDRFQFSLISIRHQDRRRDFSAQPLILQQRPGPSRSRLPRPPTSVRTQSVNPAPFFTTTRAPRPKPYDRNKPSRN